MEFADIEAITDLAPGAFSELLDFQFTDFVGERLARHRNVTIDFIDNVILKFRVVLHEIIDRLLPIPLHRMHPGIHDEPHRAPHLISQLAELRVRIFIHPHVLA